MGKTSTAFKKAHALGSKGLGTKGQIGIDTIILMFVLGIIFYVYIIAFEPIRDLMFSALDNYAYGSVMRILWQVIPLILVVLILAVPVAHHQGRGRLPQQM